MLQPSMALPMASSRPAHLSIRHPSELPLTNHHVFPTLPITPSASDVAEKINPQRSTSFNSTNIHPLAVATDHRPFEDDMYDSPTAEEIERENKYPNLTNGQLFISSLSAFAMYFHPVTGAARDWASSSLMASPTQDRSTISATDGDDQEDLDEEDIERIGEEVYHLILDIRFVIGSDEWAAYDESVRDHELVGEVRSNGFLGAERKERGEGNKGVVSRSRSQARGRDPLPTTTSSSNLSAMNGNKSSSSTGPSPIASTSKLPDTKPKSKPKAKPNTSYRPIHLPNVYKITLFGAEHVEESLTRAEAIGEIIGSCGQSRPATQEVEQDHEGNTNHHEEQERQEVMQRERRRSGPSPIEHMLASRHQSRRQSRADIFASQAGSNPIQIDTSMEADDQDPDSSYPFGSCLPSALSPKSAGGGFSAWGSGSRMESGMMSAHGFGRRSAGVGGNGFGGGFTGLAKSNGDARDRGNGIIHEGKAGLLDPGWREVAMYSEEARGPMEVEWLTSLDVPLSTLTFSTHLIHPAIIQAGKRWGKQGCLRKMAVRGGFPIPIKVVDPDAEDSWEASRPDYSFALKDWLGANGLEILIWSFLGAYNESSSCSILKRLFDFLQTGFSQGRRHCQTLIMEDLLPVVREKLFAKDSTTMFRLGLSKSSVPFLQWLEDIILIEVRDDESGHVDMNRLWDTELSEEGEDKLRVLRRFKSDMLANDHRTKRHPGLKVGLKARDGTVSLQERSRSDSLRFDVGPAAPPLLIDPGTPVPVLTPPLDPSDGPVMPDMSPLASRNPSCIFSASTSTASLATCPGSETRTLPSPTIALGQLGPDIGEDSRTAREDRPGLEKQSSMLEMKKSTSRMSPADAL